MSVKQTISPPPDRLAAGFCRRPDVDVNWWVDTHHTQYHNRCQHKLSKHICLEHCPVLATCEEDTPAWGTDWNGMVVAGVLRTRRKGVAMASPIQPGDLERCKFCGPPAKTPQDRS